MSPQRDKVRTSERSAKGRLAPRGSSCQSGGSAAAQQRSESKRGSSSQLSDDGAKDWGEEETKAVARLYDKSLREDSKMGPCSDDGDDDDERMSYMKSRGEPLEDNDDKDSFGNLSSLRITSSDDVEKGAAMGIDEDEDRVTIQSARKELEKGKKTEGEGLEALYVAPVRAEPVVAPPSEKAMWHSTHVHGYPERYPCKYTPLECCWSFLCACHGHRACEKSRIQCCCSHTFCLCCIAPDAHRLVFGAAATRFNWLCCAICGCQDLCLAVMPIVGLVALVEPIKWASVFQMRRQIVE